MQSGLSTTGRALSPTEDAIATKAEGEPSCVGAYNVGKYNVGGAVSG